MHIQVNPNNPQMVINNNTYFVVLFYTNGIIRLMETVSNYMGQCTFRNVCKYVQLRALVLSLPLTYTAVSHITYSPVLDVSWSNGIVTKKFHTIHTTYRLHLSIRAQIICQRQIARLRQLQLLFRSLFMGKSIENSSANDFFRGFCAAATISMQSWYHCTTNDSDRVSSRMIMQDDKNRHYVRLSVSLNGSATLVQSRRKKK